jgi:hypothetical protein
LPIILKVGRPFCLSLSKADFNASLCVIVVYLFVCLFVCLSVYLSVCLFCLFEGENGRCIGQIN